MDSLDYISMNEEGPDADMEHKDTFPTLQIKRSSQDLMWTEYIIIQMWFYPSFRFLHFKNEKKK